MKMESQRKFLDGTQKEKTGEEAENDDLREKGGFVAMQPA
jgi:hypothetical protein